MSVDIELLRAETEAEYDAFLRSIPESLVYVSTAYRRFLAAIVPDAEPAYFLARRGGAIIGALPSFTCPGPWGPVANSLPFYGSNGGVLVAPALSAAEQEQVSLALLAAFDAHCAAQGVVAATLVESPFAGVVPLGRLWPHDFEDQRIGQFTRLPVDLTIPDREFEDSLMALFHAKTRNCVRKAGKSGVQSRIDNSPEAIRALADLHRENMESIGGLHKPLRVFEALAKELAPGAGFNVYIATREGRTCAMLLVLYFNRVAEYFTPATVETERVHQPMSMLIHQAMKDCVVRGFAWWNWGGTWLTQEGVYQFKSRWGTTDHPYRYFARVGDRSLLDRSQQDLTQAYAPFFVVPFSELCNSCKE